MGRNVEQNGGWSGDEIAMVAVVVVVVSTMVKAWVKKMVVETQVVEEPRFGGWCDVEGIVLAAVTVVVIVVEAVEVEMLVGVEAGVKVPTLK